MSYEITLGLDADAGVSHTSDGNDTQNHSIMATTGLTYNLLKTTLLYDQFRYVNNHGKMSTSLSTNGALYSAGKSTFGTIFGMHRLFYI